MLDKCKVLLVLLLLPLLGGCNDLTGTTAGKILPPAYETCPLEGKWTVMEELAAEGYGSASGLHFESVPLQFSREMVIIGDKLWKQPSYKIKKVNSRDYLLTRYIVLDDYLASIDQTLKVITLFADANYLGEFMKIDEGTVVAFVQNRVLLLKKVAERADDSSTAAKLMAANIDYDNTGTSGVFLGLRIPSHNDYTYKTVWIAADDKQLRPVLSRDDIFFPRLSGFWELRVESGGSPGRAELRARNVAIKEAAEENVAVPSAAVDTQSIVIDYVSNDYVTVARNISGMDKLQVLPVDQISSPLGIKAVDLLGETGAVAYRHGRQQGLQILHSQGITMIDKDASEDNFGLTRRNGHWHLQGRINYHHNDTPATLEFNINFIPPESPKFYNTLYLSWQSIRDRVPNATDAFTSPNKDIAVIKTTHKLYLFGISGEQLDSVPRGEIDLPEGTSIIMAEWATGFYVDEWEKNFINNGAQG